jgi:hypothetical protein
MGIKAEYSSVKNKFVIAIWAGVSSNDALSSPARTKLLLRRLPRIQTTSPHREMDDAITTIQLQSNLPQRILK